MRTESSKSPAIPASNEPSNVSEATVADPSHQDSSSTHSGPCLSQDSAAAFAEQPTADQVKHKDSALSRQSGAGGISGYDSLETANSAANPDSLVLSRYDQPTLVALLLISSLAVIGWSLWQSRLLRTRTIDIDEARRSPLVFVIDLNEASATELANLPGVGPKLADAIIAYRREQGSFSTPADLLNVSGIGEAKLKAILPYLRPLGPLIEPNSLPSPPAEVR